MKHARRIRLGLGLGVALVGALVTAVGSAQEARVQIARGPYYVGEAFELQVVATDFEEDPTPEVEFTPAGDSAIRFAGVSPSTSTSISIINGRMSRVREVEFVYRYAFTGLREGRVSIPAFRVSQGTTTRMTEAFEVEISGVPRTDVVGLEVDIPDGPIFVGQRIPVAIEFRVEREAQRDLISYQARVPLFDLATLRFLDEPPPRTDTHLEIETAAGTLRLPATSEERTIGGRPFLVVRAERTLIALSPDPIRAEAPSVFITRGTRFRRDLFNQRQAVSAEKALWKGEPTRIEVAEVPREGRPASFAGAVGEGFSLEVSADRSVVQLGEPIQLSFLLRGDGDLSSASLPPLDAEGLFDPTRFRLPDEPPAGIVDEEGKRFEVTLRVLDAGVREIPALAYSWFDAQTRRFETTASRPIALSVGAAEIIGADAVARRLDSEEEVSTGSTPTSRPSEPADAAARSSSLALTGADLAVERDPDVLLRDERTVGSLAPVSLALYAAGLGLLGLGLVDRRRRARDPRLIEREAALRRAAEAVEAALGQTGAESAGALGRALRELIAALPEEAGPEFDRLIEECDALRFAPVGTGTEGGNVGAGLPEPLRERARRFVADRQQTPGGASPTPGSKEGA